MTYANKIIASPVGKLKLVASDTGLAAILWENDSPRRVRLGPLVEDPANPILVETERQLAAYFAGTLKAFMVPLDFEGTDFQKSVWTALLAIPFGETRSYAAIARQIGRPTAARAVGAANGKTRSRSSHRAIASSVPTAPSPASPAASRQSSTCSGWSAGRWRRDTLAAEPVSPVHVLVNAEVEQPVISEWVWCHRKRSGLPVQRGT